jgi:NDP-sugar pyrophosphorylase family protein
MILKDVKAVLLAEKKLTVRGLPLDLPLALIDVLGSSILQRTIDRLRAGGIEDVTVVADFGSDLAASLSSSPLQDADFVQSPSDGEVTATAEQVFRDMAPDASHILILRVNAYAEVNIQQLVSHHIHFHNRVTRVWCGNDEPLPLDLLMVSAGRLEDGLRLLRSGLAESFAEGVRYRSGADEYVNRVRDARELRQLAADALHLRCQLEPIGEQIRPGIWVGESSRVARDARLVAPVYIGKRTKIRAGAVVTRGSAIEHHCAVDCGTVVENATILPFSEIGPCLDLSHSVAVARHIVHLNKNVVTEIHDGRILNSMSASPFMRVLTVAGSLFSFLPQNFCRGLFGQSTKTPATALPVNTFGTTHGFNSSSKEKADLPDMAPGLAVVRRYGNQ